MKTSVHLLSIIVGAMFFLGCGTLATVNSHRDFAELTIESYPKGWGFADKTVKKDGSITGGHFSGGPDALTVFEDKAQITSKDMSKLRSRVASITAEEPNREPSRPDQKVGGYTAVVIVFRDGSTRTFFAKWGQRFPSKPIQEIWEILSKYDVGAW